MIEVKKYTDDYRDKWNEFLKESKNSTFLFHRNFMEYHKDRFSDYSLIIEEDSKVVALLPANIRGNEVVSHGGLTYGGIVLGMNATLMDTLRFFGHILKYLETQKIGSLIYKSLPRLYHTIPSDEIDYALFLIEAELFRRDTTFAIELTNRLDYQTRRKRSIKKAQREGILIKEETDYSSFWNEILTVNLQKRFGTNPVHSLEEITLLSQRFPQNIRQFSAYKGDVIVAGTTIFETPIVAHAQYISASDEGRNNGAIDFLFAELIENRFREKKYFNFGIANEFEGRKLNRGLTDWKEGFGARTLAQDFYKINTSNYNKLFAAIQDDKIS